MLNRKTSKISRASLTVTPPASRQQTEPPRFFLSAPPPPFSSPQRRSRRRASSSPPRHQPHPPPPSRSASPTAPLSLSAGSAAPRHARGLVGWFSSLGLGGEKISLLGLGRPSALPRPIVGSSWLRRWAALSQSCFSPRQSYTPSWTSTSTRWEFQSHPLIFFASLICISGSYCYSAYRRSNSLFRGVYLFQGSIDARDLHKIRLLT
jgi:hypothetical protein